MHAHVNASQSKKKLAIKRFYYLIMLNHELYMRDFIFSIRKGFQNDFFFFFLDKRKYTYISYSRRKLRKIKNSNFFHYTRFLQCKVRIVQHNNFNLFQ